MQSELPVATAQEHSTPWLWALGSGCALLIWGSAAHPSYGYFFDEFYFLACARHPALGYVDVAPLSIWLLAAVRRVAGDGLLVIRALPALAAGMSAILAGSMARRLGAGAPGQLLAALSVASAPLVLATSSVYTPNPLRIVLTAGATYATLALLQGGGRPWWLAMGACCGLGLLNKHDFALPLIGLACGILCSPLRRQLATGGPWLAGALVMLSVLPNLYWQVENGYPSWEFYRFVAERDATAGPLRILINQIEISAPSAAIWLLGLLFFVRGHEGRRYRLFAWAYLAPLAVLLLLQHGRPDRLDGLFPVLCAGGACLLDRASERRHWIRWLVPTLVGVVGLATLPLSLPLLAPERLIRYPLLAEAVKAQPDPSGGPIPILLANRTGWDSMVEEVAAAYGRLRDAGHDPVLLVSDAGHAGALELLGPQRGLPAHVLSPHLAYRGWSTAQAASYPGASRVLCLGFTRAELEQWFEHVVPLSSVECRYCMRWRDGLAIYSASAPRAALVEIVAGLDRRREATWQSTPLAPTH